MPKFPDFRTYEKFKKKATKALLNHYRQGLNHRKAQYWLNISLHYSNKAFSIAKHATPEDLSIYSKTPGWQEIDDMLVRAKRKVENILDVEDRNFLLNNTVQS